MLPAATTQPEARTLPFAKLQGPAAVVAPATLAAPDTAVASRRRTPPPPTICAGWVLEERQKSRVLTRSAVNALSNRIVLICCSFLLRPIRIIRPGSILKSASLELGLRTGSFLTIAGRDLALGEEAWGFAAAEEEVQRVNGVGDVDSGVGVGIASFPAGRRDASREEEAERE